MEPETPDTPLPPSLLGHPDDVAAPSLPKSLLGDEEPQAPENGLMSGLKFAGKKLLNIAKMPYQGYKDIYSVGKEALKGTGRPEVAQILAEYMRPNPEDPEAAPSKDHTLGGLAGNVLKSTFTGVRDIGESLATSPVAGALAALELKKEIQKKGAYHYDPTDVFKSWRDDLGPKIGDALVEKYAKNYQEQNPGEWVTNPQTGKMEKKSPSLLKAVGETAYEDPFQVVTDAMAIKDLGTATLKAVGKTVGSKALIDTANRIAHIEGELAGKALDKVLPEKWSEYLANRKEVLQYKGEEGARARVLAAADEQAALKDYVGLTKEQSKQIRDVHLMGEAAPPEALDAIRANPEMYAAWKNYGDYLKNNREAYLEQAGLLDPKVMADRVAAQYAVAKYGNMEEATVKLAKREIAEMREFKPVYVPTKREAEILAAHEMIPFERPEHKMGKVPFLERFSGKAPFYEMPQEYIPKVVHGWRKVEGNIRWIQKIQDSPALVQAVKGAPRESVIPTQGIFSKYFEGGGRTKAQGVFIRDLIEKHGYEEAAGRLLSDAATQKKLRQVTAVVANPAVRHILRMEFSKWAQTPGAALRLYDRIMNVFRLGATKYNPHYYAGNAVGDAVLSLVYGMLPSELRIGDRLKGFSPMQARRGASMVAEGVRGKLSNLFDYLNEVDASTKRGVIVKEVANHLKDTGISAFEMDRHLKEILPAIENLSDAQVARAQLQEAIARKVTAKLAKETEIRKGTRINEASAAANAQTKRELAVVDGSLKLLKNDVEPNVAGIRADGDLIRAKRLQMSDLADKLDAIRKKLHPFEVRYAELKKWADDVKYGHQAENPVLRDELQKLDTAFKELTDKTNRELAFYQKTEQEIKDIERFGMQPKERYVKNLFPEMKEMSPQEVQRIRDLLEKRRSDLAGKINPTVDVSKLNREKSKLIRQLTGQLTEGGKLEALLPEMRKNAAIVRPAVERANQLTGDYLGMGPIEQYLFRRIVPFYAFNKTMSMLAFRLPFIAPKSTFLWNRYSAFLSSMIDDPENPPYLKNYMPMFARENGDLVWASMKGLSPFGGVKRSRIAKYNIPSVLAFWEQHPLISVGFKMAGGKTLFSRSSIPYGELLTDAHNGSQYEFQEDGSVRKVIDEPDLIPTVSEFFPSVKLAERVLIPYQLAPEGWLLHPVPARQPRTGEITEKSSVFNRPGMTVLDLIGLRTMEKNPDKVKSDEARRKIDIVRDAQRAIRNADPDKRPAMIQHLQDFLKAGMPTEPD